MATTIVWFRYQPAGQDSCEVYTLAPRHGANPAHLTLMYCCHISRSDAHRILARMAPYHMATRLPLNAAGRSVLLSAMFALGAPACGAQVGYRSVPVGMLLNNPNLSVGVRWTLAEQTSPSIAGGTSG